MSEEKKKCNCKNFKQLVIKNRVLEDVQHWNFCGFCGKKMKVSHD